MRLFVFILLLCVVWGQGAFASAITPCDISGTVLEVLNEGEYLVKTQAEPAPKLGAFSQPCPDKVFDLERVFPNDETYMLENPLQAGDKVGVSYGSFLSMTATGEAVSGEKWLLVPIEQIYNRIKEAEAVDE